ncbi:MAG: hypothetical protein COV72_08795 [Candidatus Omnitrophica bacterium CG11_big_fil_rev_8_21_14_0_20_42_13]|uniref:peptidylprolyl isomerase n=1 Tax=Candidatus Ghiorseimicrobium undicola TaxID=1974746 RepID=A0A2H0LVF1_9BACT|nr:MAG: hypothetical protein COV72_08795 [Candidatus Omnitrophica bacterium CG11_big_fil_rev_8_21_14_0_20_42_13]
MKYFYFLSFMFLFVIIPSACAQDHPGTQLAQDRIVAIVNNEIITQSDIDELLAVFYMQLPENYSEERKEEEIIKKQPDALKRLIEDKLILEEAKHKGLEISERAVDERYKELKERFASDNDFQDSLIAQGLTPADLRKRIKEQMMMASIVDVNVNKAITVSPTEITAYYQAHRDEYKKPETAEVDSIYADSEARIDEAFNLLSNGENFEEVKGRFSSGASLGVVGRGELLSDIEEAIFALEEGQVSGVIKTDGGFYIFKLLSKKPQEQLSLADIEAEIKDRLVKEKKKEKFSQWVNGLKEKAYIIIK